MNSKIEIFKSKDSQTEIKVQFENDTVWLSQKQLNILFQTDRTSISKHIKNIYKTKELDEKSTCAIFAQVQKEGNRTINRNIKYYNLDLIISLGYRINSIRGTQFRIWATQRLKDYLVKGYAINEKRLAEKNQEIKYLKTGISILNRAIESKIEDADNQWLNIFAKGLKILDDYDHETLDKQGKTLVETKYPTNEAYQEIIFSMKSEFDSDVFGKEKDKSFQSSIAQIEKGFEDKDFYPSIEEKAATLLYLIVKNHSFVDGNKRIAAACFLLFLKENKILFNKEMISRISNDALASITLFVASSKSEEMEVVKKLITSILNRN